MLTIPSDIKVFLEDNTTNILEYKGTIYQKVQYSNDLIILYRTKHLELNYLNLNMVGVFSLHLNNFICLSCEFDNDEIFEVSERLNTADDLYNLHCVVLQKDLNTLIHRELENILKLQVKTNVNSSKEVKEAAISYFKANSEPTMNFDNYTINLDFSNLENFALDKEDFAFNCADEIFNKEPDLLKHYQWYKDVSYALEELKNGNHLDLELYEVFNRLSKEPNYKTYNVFLTKDGMTSCLESMPIQNILNYPYYAIKKIYWGRKLLFSMDDYNEKKVKELRTNVKFNIEQLESINKNSFSDAKSTFLSYVDKSLFQSYDFCCAIVNNVPSSYSLIDKSLKENISFIKQSLGKVYLGSIVENVSEDFILKNENFFLDLLNKKNEDIYGYFPKNIKEKDSFMLKLISEDGLYALNKIPENMFFHKNIQEAFDDWFKVNPLNPIYQFYSYENIKLERLKNPDTILQVLTISNFKNLDKNLVNDISFMKKFLDRISSFKENEQCEFLNNFHSIYENLEDLKTNKTLIMEFMKLFSLTEFDFRILDESLKNDEDIQRVAIENNAQLLPFVNDNLKEEMVLKDAPAYLPCLGKKPYDEDLFIKIAKSSINKPSNLKALKNLTYTQEDDEKLAKTLIDINPKTFEYLSYGLKHNRNIAKLVINKGVSIIPMLPNKTKYQKSLFDDKEIMEESIKISPLDFMDIPQTSRSTGPALLLEDRDFVLFAIKLEAYNAKHLPTKSEFREDAEIAKAAILGDMEQAIEFSNKLFKDEDFVYSIMDEVYQYTYNGYLDDIREYILDRVPKKIKNSKDFIAKYPLLKD